MESLSKQVLEANEKHKNALDEYSRKLRTELDAVNKLISAVENISDDTLQEDPEEKWCLHANGAFKPNSIIDRTQILKEKSPFFAEALRKERYTKCLVPNPFSASEKRCLEKAIIKENKRLTALRAQEQGEDPFEAVSRLDNQSFLENVDGINWEYVARDVSALNSQADRSAQECKLRWLGHQHPRINLQRWSEDEEARLHDLVETQRESGRLDWEEISRLLKTNRTPLHCIKHYQASTRPIFRWTCPIDNKLREAVEKHGVNNWALVACSVSERVSANQCQIRYERSLNPDIKRGRFTAEEDELLMKMVEAHGTEWMKVAQDLPGRTNTQCRARYSLLLAGAVTEPWSAEEDTMLRAAVNEHGHDWDKVREEMGARRPQTQYASHYRMLTRSDAHDAKEHRDKQSMGCSRSVLHFKGASTGGADATHVIITMDTRAAASKAPIELPTTTGTDPVINGGDRIPVTIEGELNTTQKTTGAKRGRKRKIAPSIVETDGQTEAPRRLRRRPQPASPVAVPPDSGANMDIDPISQNVQNHHVGDPSRTGDFAPDEGNMQPSQKSSEGPQPEVDISTDTSMLSDLTDLESEPPMEKRDKKRAHNQRGRLSNTCRESKGTHTMITRAKRTRPNETGQTSYEIDCE